MGSGILGVPAEIAAEAGTVGAIALLWLAGSAITLRPAVIGGIALIFAAYVGTLVPLSETGVRVVAAAAIVALGATNARLAGRRRGLPARQPGVFLLASFAMLANALVGAPGSTLFSFGVIGAGVVAYRVWRASAHRK